jgi:hypothetical protein
LLSAAQDEIEKKDGAICELWAIVQKQVRKLVRVEREMGTVIQREAKPRKREKNED